ncbi:SDR family NAD(P)-dependent oxidoreductase [Thermogemmatispora sp.]|uniref:SDR family NAD(P)-dependent oxidoreductase n=1 Tax=Thermogemmatispora sp. TaxID=1968838 RepID=UPI0035E41C11
MYPATLEELFSLAGRVALITGASGDLGWAMAHGLAIAGAQVALNGRAQDRLERLRQELQERGTEAASFSADLEDLAALPQLIQAVVAHFGRLDILVNCAGINLRQPFLEVSPADYDQIMRTNLRSVYFLCQAAAPQMIRQGGGQIINVGSLTSTIGLNEVSVYGLTKAAIVQLTKTLAIELAAYNIRVNCICPGFMATRLTVPLWDDPRRRSWMLERLPIKRPGEPDDLIGLLIYLASEASRYVTGQAIYVDGGFLAGGHW